MKSFVFQNCKFNLIHRTSLSSKHPLFKDEIIFYTNDDLYFFSVCKEMNSIKSFTIEYVVMTVKFIKFLKKDNKVYRSELSSHELNKVTYNFNSTYNDLIIKSGFRSSFFEAKREAIRIKDLAEIYI